MKSLDELLPIVAFAFALSMVSERLSNLLKLYLPGLFRFFRVVSRTLALPALRRRSVFFCKKHLPILLRLYRHFDNNFRFKKSAFVWENLHLKQTDVELETIRERIILLLSLWSGWLIAGLFGDEIGDILGKKDPEGLEVFLIIFGFGTLFSFGSKFWHDMLDLLLATKNVKRRWGDVNLSELESAQQLADYLQVTDRDMVMQAIRQNEAWLKRDFLGIRTIAPGYEYLDGAYQHCAVVYLIGAKPINFPTHLPLMGSNKKVAIKVVDKLGQVEAHGRPGSRVQGASNHGAFGCMVHKLGAPDINYILTCAHVVTGRKKNFNKNELSGLRFKALPEEKLSIEEGCLLFEGGFDCALIGPVSSSSHTNLAGITDWLKAPRLIIPEDEGIEVYAHVNNPREERHTGKIISLVKDVEVKYDDDTMMFYAMIMVESQSALYKFTERGDSGTVIYDQAGHVLGLVVGGDDYYSYALPMTDVMLQLSIQFSS